MVNAQEWLESQEEYNTKEKREQITRLVIRYKELDGELDLSDFVNLEILGCDNNQLTNLNLSKCVNLTELYCYQNQLTQLLLPTPNNLQALVCYNNLLTELDFSLLNSEKLIFLDLRNNNFSTQDLSCLARFIQLGGLGLGTNNKEKIDQGIYDCWEGSLESLKNLTKLRGLDISNTDINSGWEYLSSSLKKIYFSSEERPNSKVKEIAEQLEWINKGFSGQEVKRWLDVGLQPDDYYFAFYLTEQGHSPYSVMDLEKLRVEYNKKNQEWLEQNYPDKWETKTIYINQQLAGVLDCGEYKNLWYIFISTSVDSSKFEIKKCSYKDYRDNKIKETQIIPCISASDYLNQNYPKDGVCVRKEEKRSLFGKVEIDNFGKEREQITELDISHKGLEGNLDLSDFTNLEELDCSYSCLTNLNVNDCWELKRIVCWYNQLTALDLSNLEQLGTLFCSNHLTQIPYLPNPEEITFLVINNNNLSLSDLTIFSPMRNLIWLWIGNDDKNKIHQGIYNRIEGSLEPLKDLNKLQSLDISNTDITSGWEYLPDSLEKFEYGTKLRPDCKLALATTELEKLWKEVIPARKSEKQINQFIQEAKVKKIPYEQFTYITYLAEGGFGKIYQAEWKDKLVILKSLNNSQNVTPEFLQEIASHKLFDKETKTKIIKCHGISQDPTGNYVMIMDYARGGNLRDYLQKNNKRLNLKRKLIQLQSIAEGLKTIHDKGLVHKDFHLGNILSSGSETYITDLKCHITDLGLCKPVSVENKEDGIFGVLPYVASEVLQQQLYTQKSDIYSFGAVAYGVLVGQPPFSDQSYSTGLAVRILRGERPQFLIRIPQLLENLIKRCWDANPEQRPTAEELNNTLNKWSEEVSKGQDTEFTQQLREVEKYNETLPDEIKYPQYELHLGAVQHSKLINTKLIAQAISKPIEDFDIPLTESVEILTIPKENKEEQIMELQKQLEKAQQKNKKWENKVRQLQTQLEELQAQIQIPPKNNN